MARVIKELFTSWFKILDTVVKDEPDEFIRIRLAWSIVKQQMFERKAKTKSNKYVSSMVHGLLSNVIGTLIKIGRLRFPVLSCGQGTYRYL